MGDLVEKGFDVCVYDDAKSFLSVTGDGGDGLAGVASLSKPEASLGHLRVEEGIEDLKERLAHDAVGDDGNSQGS